MKSLILFAVCVMAMGQAQQRATATKAGSVSHGGMIAANAGWGECSDYILGANDQFEVLIPDVEELNGKQFRIDQDGRVQLPLVGIVRAGGLTTLELGREIDKGLDPYLNKPEAVVTITDFRSRPVSVLGSVTNPGVYQIQGCKTLFEVLSSAGGLKPDAGDKIRITRERRWGPIPLPGSSLDSSGRFNVASVGIKSIMDASHPEENISIAPGDVISVPQAELVYAVGAVRKPGGFVLGENESISVLQMISLAEGPERTAATKRAKILRPVPGTTRREEIPVNLAKILAGQTNDDIRLRANDILFVPDSAGKSFGAKTFDAAITAITGAAIYRPF